MSVIVTVAVHGTSVPHAARLRPSDGAIAGFGNGYVAETGIPGRLWKFALVCTPQGNTYVPASFTCVCPFSGSVFLQNCGATSATAHASVVVRPVATPPDSMPPWPNCAFMPTSIP